VNGGIALIVVGGLAGVGSLAASVAIAAQQDQQRSYALPLALSLLSTAAIGGGIALVATSHSTHYSTEP